MCSTSMVMQCGAVSEKILPTLEISCLLLPPAEGLVQDDELASFIPQITILV